MLEFFVGCGKFARLDENEDEREYASLLERWRALRGHLTQVGDDEWQERDLRGGGQ